MFCPHSFPTGSGSGWWPLPWTVLPGCVPSCSQGWTWLRNQTSSPIPAVWSLVPGGRDPGHRPQGLSPEPLRRHSWDHPSRLEPEPARPTVSLAPTLRSLPLESLQLGPSRASSFGQTLKTLKLNKTVVVHGSLSSFSAIWSLNLSGLRAQICVLSAPVTRLLSLLMGGSPPRRDLLAISVPSPARRRPEKLLAAAWLPGHLCTSPLLHLLGGYSCLSAPRQGQAGPVGASSCLLWASPLTPCPSQGPGSHLNWGFPTFKLCFWRNN